ncbi:acyl-CoA dehydrogenase family protein [Paenibacillus contaminans]|uniref:Acyl-CoA dehydrogenase n=1 Tax=Paenibacillus contaminans TaxID=450362 RepID=A0A329MTH3_9BACL|nr:acyl-CoA dehydrogenase family protein [Paenibacillus contaminans]RAV22840.1 acyl-CoA dehydrogenase [Paenibacillus contaminans]
MRFRLSEEHEMTRSVIREFAEKEVAPSAGRRDEEERFDRGLWTQMAALGLTGIPWPERYGGAGSDVLAFAVVVEELSRVCASTGAALGAHTHAGWLIGRYGGETLKRDCLHPLASGNLLGSCGFPHDIARKSSADRRHKAPVRAQGVVEGAAEEAIKKAPSGLEVSFCEDDGDFLLNGTFPYVNGAEEADLFVFHAAGCRDNRERSARDLTFVTWKETRGITAGAKKRKLGLRAWPTGEITFQNKRLSREHIIGESELSREIVLSSHDFRHISDAAQAVGIMQGALEAAVAYAKERKQFGERIGRRQGISFKLADMAAKLDASRLLTYQAAWRLDEGLSCGKEAAAAGAFSVQAAVASAIEAVQVFGGYGYMREYRVERFLRDAKCLQANAGEERMRGETIEQLLADN